MYAQEDMRAWQSQLGRALTTEDGSSVQSCIDKYGLSNWITHFV
jgi:hypothetical protein